MNRETERGTERYIELERQGEMKICVRVERGQRESERKGKICRIRETWRKRDKGVYMQN
jgi:hypothetical protein